jgi:isopentenyl-diphosphate delta-isomerase
MEEHVILVDELDNEIGTMPKLEAHQKNQLHRAFSVFIWNSKNEMLLQKRASSKYHSPNLWTNACCSHPRQNESTIDAAHRRLQEEIGITTKLTHSFQFIYQIAFENNLFENELDHVFIGKYDATPALNLDEVSEYRWVRMEDLQKEIEQAPSTFTYWFKYIIDNYPSKIIIHS